MAIKPWRIWQETSRNDGAMVRCGQWATAAAKSGGGVSMRRAAARAAEGGEERNGCWRVAVLAGREASGDGRPHRRLRVDRRLRDRRIGRPRRLDRRVVLAAV